MCGSSRSGIGVTNQSVNEDAGPFRKHATMAIDVIIEISADGRTAGRHHVPIPTASKAEWREFLDKKTPARRKTTTRWYFKRTQTQRDADREEAKYRKLFAEMQTPFPEVPVMYHESVVAFFRYIGYDPDTKSITQPEQQPIVTIRQRK